MFLLFFIYIFDCPAVRHITFKDEFSNYRACILAITSLMGWWSAVLPCFLSGFSALPLPRTAHDKNFRNDPAHIKDNSGM